MTTQKGQTNQERVVTTNWTYAANASVEKLVVQFEDSGNVSVPTTDSNPKTITSPASDGSAAIRFRVNDKNQIAKARVTQVLSNGSVYLCVGPFGEPMSLADFSCGLTGGGEAPTLTTSAGTTGFVEGGGAVTVDGDIVVNGSTIDSFRSGRVSIDEGFDAGVDVLGFDSSLIPTDSDGNPLITGSYNRTTGVLRFNGTADPAVYQDLFRTVTYDNGESPPSTIDRNITFTLTAADQTSREVFYNPATGNYYEHVESAGVPWDGAKTAAAGRYYAGMSGYLATVTSEAENEFLYDRFQAAGWIGASDAASEGTWRWVTGPEGTEEGGAGRTFFNQSVAHVAFTDQYPDPPAGVPGGGTAVNGEYSNWARNHEPDNKFPFFGGQDAAYLCFGPGACPDGTWMDAAAGSPPFSADGYFVEYGGQGDVPESGTVNLRASKTVTITTSVSDDTPPTATATANATSVAPNETIQFDGSGSDGTGSNISRYEWDTSGNGRADLTGATNTTSFARAGNHTVTLTVTDGGGNTDTDAVTVTVEDTNPPTAVISVNGSTTVERGATIEFTGTNSTDDVAIQSFEWAFGDGSPNSSEVSPSHGYDATGTYTVDLTVTDTAGNAGSTSQEITVESSPRPKIHDFNLTNPTGSSLNASVTTDQQLSDVVVEVYDTDALTPRDDDSGAFLFSMAFTDFAETSANGNYTYTNTTAGLADGNYTARLVTASNSNGDSGTGQEDTASIDTDSTPPAFATGYPTTRNPTTTTFDVAVMADEAGTAYWVVVADGATAPSTAQVRSGLDASDSAAIASGNGSIAANVEATFTADGLSPGTAYDAYVVVEDGRGNTNTSTGLDESTTDDTAPALANATLTDATDGNGIVASGDSVTISVDATDADGVATVTANASALGAGSAVALADGDGAWNATITVGSAGTPIEGTQTVDLAANDTLGNENATTTGSLEVDTTGPSITGMSGPANGTHPIGDTLQFAVSYDDAVAVTGTPSIDLDVGGTVRSANLASGAGSSTLTFKYTLQAGDDDADGIGFANTTIQLDGGTMADGGGNDADRNFSAVTPSLAKVNADGTRPQDPDSTGGATINASNVGGYAVDVTFSSAPEAGTVTVDLDDGSANLTASTAADTSDTTTTITGIDASSLAEGSVNLTAKIVDSAGNENRAGYTAESTVTKDTVAPRIMNFSVADGPGTTLNVSFDSNESLSTVSVAITGDATTNLTSFQQSGSTYYATDDVGTNGTFTATLENATDVAGNDAGTASDSLTTVDPASVDAVAIASSYQPDVGTDVRFDASGSTIPENQTATFGWTFGDGNSSSAETTWHAFSTPGTYTVNLSVSVGEVTANDSITVAVEDNEPPVADAGSDLSVPNGTAVTFDGSGSTDDVGVTGYTWRFGDGGTDTSQSTTHTYAQPGTYEASLTVEDAAGHSHADRVTVVVLGPRTVAGTTAIAYGNVSTGSTNVSSVPITNAGNVPLNVTNATINGADAGAFALAGSAASALPTIQPGATGSIAVAFSPVSVGGKAATLAIATNDADVDVDLTGRGVESDLEFDASTIDFGDVDVESTERRSVTVENNGSSAATIASVSVVGSARSSYSIVDDAGLPDTMSTAEQRTITVEFAPADPGERTAAVLIETDDGTRIAVALEGTGRGPIVSVESGPIDFGEVGKGKESTENVTIANHGNTALSVEDVTVTGANSSAFTVTNSPTTVAAGSAEPVTVTFAPEEAENYSVRLEVATDDPATHTSLVDLQGTGFAAEIGVDQRNLDFGTVTVGNTSTLNITVTNLATSKANLTVDSLVMTGRDPSHFDVVNVDAPFTLAPGEIQRLEVAFTPLTEGVKQAQLRILSDAANRPQIDVWLSNTRTYVVVQEVGVDVRTEPKVDIDAKNLEAEDGLSVNVSQRSTDGRTAGFDELAMTVVPGGDFTMNLTYSDEPLSETFDGDGVDAFQYIDLAHALPNSAFDDTSIRYRVNKETLPKGTDPDDVRFRRYNTTDGAWRSHAATLVSESDTHYVYSVDTPGFSAFVLTAPSASDGGGGGGGGDAGSGGGSGTVSGGDDPEPTPEPTAPSDEDGTDETPTDPPQSTPGAVEAIGVISLDGAADGTPSVNIDPEALIFGDVPVGSTVTRELVLENRVTSETTFAVDSLAVAGQHPENFEVVGGDAPVDLAPGETHRVEIAYTATVNGERNAQLAVRSNAASEQIDVWLSNTPGYVVVQSVAVDAESPEASPEVAIEGFHIARDSKLAINVSREQTRAKAANVESVGMTVLSGGDFDMLLSHVDGPFDDTPAVSTDPDFRVLQYVRLDHSMPNAELEQTSFEYRVRKQALPAGTGPGSITFYRYADGAWNAHESELLSETPSAYRFRVATPGFSTFAVTGPTEVPKGDCSLFGQDFGHFLVCWYWWVLLIALLIATAIGHRRYRKRRDRRADHGPGSRL